MTRTPERELHQAAGQTLWAVKSNYQSYQGEIDETIFEQTIPFVMFGLFAATAAHAAWAYDSSIRGSIGSFSLDYQDQAQSVSGSSAGFTLSYIGRFNPYLGFDARIGAAGSTSAAGLTLKPGAFLSLLFRPSLPVSETVDIYGLLGFTSLAVGRTPAGGSEEIVARVGTSVGLGADFRINQHMAVGVEWVSYQHNVDYGPSSGNNSWIGVTQAEVSLSALAASFRYQF